MIKSSPKVFAKGRFQLSFNNRDCRYSDKTKNNRVKYSKDMLDYFANEKKVAVNLIDYFTGKINKKEKVNLIIENGEYATEEQLKKRKEFIGKQIYNSNLWKLVVSFNNEYIDERITLKDLEQKMIKEVMPRFLKHLEFEDLSKMMYQISLHGNTDNYHFHIAFMEKEPNTLDKNNNITYRRFGKLKKSDYNYLRNLVAISIERDIAFNPMIKNINMEIEEFKQYFGKNNKNMIIKKHQDLLLEENILLLGKMLNERKLSDKKIKFNSITDQYIKDLTKSISKYIFKNDPEIKKLKKDFDNSILKLHDYLYLTGKSNNMKNRDIDYSIVNNKQEYLNNYIYNYIVNYSKNNYKNKSINSTKNDIIQEIILQNYKKNKNMTKKDILHNYLKSNKFINRQEIRNAIKNINYEMEEASKEFSKMFQNNEYENK